MLRQAHYLPSVETSTQHRTHDRLAIKVAAALIPPIDLHHTNQCRLYLNECRLYLNECRLYLNECRLYLRVQRLSDLCNGAGTELLPHALKQTYPRHNVQSNLTWPRQGEPSPRAWATWKRTLRRLFLPDRFGSLTSLAFYILPGPWMIDTLSVGTSWPGQPSRKSQQSRPKTSIHSSNPSSSTFTTRHAFALHSSCGGRLSAAFSPTSPSPFGCP
jgi:hypothetical protein